MDYLRLRATLVLLTFPSLCFLLIVMSFINEFSNSIFCLTSRVDDVFYAPRFLCFIFFFSRIE